MPEVRLPAIGIIAELDSLCYWMISNLERRLYTGQKWRVFG